MSNDGSLFLVRETHQKSCGWENPVSFLIKSEKPLHAPCRTKWPLSDKKAPDNAVSHADSASFVSGQAAPSPALYSVVIVSEQAPV